MAQVINNFLKGKMNKDLDARLLQNGEYRTAMNAQVSKSEGANVGALENVLGNIEVKNFRDELGEDDLKSIGCLTDEINNTVYIFLTNNASADYDINSESFIVSYNSIEDNYVTLVKGKFLNFSQLNPIYGVNILEGLLFFTDNRNQPRKINVNLANPERQAVPTYYTTEDQISVAKYNPYYPIELWELNPNLAKKVHQTTMKDVSSKFYPDGGEAITVDPINASTSTIVINGSADSLIGDIVVGATVGYLDTDGNIVATAAKVINPVAFNSPSTGKITITLDQDIGPISSSYNTNGNITLIFSFNPFYENTFSGDSEFLNDKFVRFSYRFQFDDNEYSIFAPFTQPAFIPKQDGYFMYATTAQETMQSLSPSVNVTDEEDTYRSTEVVFMENKVTKIDLRIQLPYSKSTLKDKLKISSIDILYKESDALAVKVIDTIPIETIEAQAPDTSNVFVYTYNSKKPFKTLPSDEIIRVFDKVPVKALAQEISANRIIYGNFQTQHTPPETIDYNVGISVKNDFLINANPTTNNVTKVEYPSSSLKQDRNYQVGVVLSDRYGRQSTVILSKNDTTISANTETFTGSSIFSSYLDNTINKATFPGQALKVLFNQPLSPAAPNQSTGWPGIYNGDTSSIDYNPLGWYSYKIVVKQQEQEYYNVYLPGVMAAYPENSSLEFGKTSHTVLINDNINKVPRDLNEVGPTQKQFRSSVQLHGRVENINSSSPSGWNQQYYPTKEGSIVSTIAGNNDLFNGENVAEYIPSQEFYSIDSNPLIARISTTKLFGVTEENTTADVNVGGGVADSVTIVVTPPVNGSINTGDRINGTGILPGTVVNDFNIGTNTITVNKKQTLFDNTELTFFSSQPVTNVQHLAIFETDPVLSELDIFWESTTAGLINELNEAIITDSSSAASLSGFNSANFKESIIPGVSTIPASDGPNIGAGNFQLLDAFGQSITYVAGQLVLLSVKDFTQSNINRVNEFKLKDNENGTYGVQVKGDINNPYYTYSFPTEAIKFTFLFESNINGTVNQFEEIVNLSNVVPTITGCPTEVVDLSGSPGLVFPNIATLFAVNGSAAPLEKAEDLNWSIVVSPSQFGGSFQIIESVVLDFDGNGNTARKCIVQVNPNIQLANGDYSLKVTATDAGALSALCNINVTVDNLVCTNFGGPLENIENSDGVPLATQTMTYVNCEFGETQTITRDTDGTLFNQCSLGPITWVLDNPPSGTSPVSGTFDQIVQGSCEDSNPSANNSGIIP